MVTTVAVWFVVTVIAITFISLTIVVVVTGLDARIVAILVKERASHWSKESSGLNVVLALVIFEGVLSHCSEEAGWVQAKLLLKITHMCTALAVTE